MSRWMIAFFTPTFSDGSSVPETTSAYAPSGGGGPAIYSRAYQRDLRRTIMKAAGLLKEAPSKRAKKRRAKVIAKKLIPELEIFIPEAIPQVVHADYKGLFGAGEQLLRLLIQIEEKKTADAKLASDLQDLMDQYEVEERKFRRREEEIVLLLMAEAS
jgi:hypothetical protein